MRLAVLAVLGIFSLQALSSQARAQTPVDWDTLYVSPPDHVTRLSVPDLPEETLLRMLFIPGELVVDGELPQSARKVAAFRRRHPAVEFGQHERLVNRAYVFRRRIDDPRSEDDVVIVFDAKGKTTINVSRVYPDDTLLQDAMTGSTSFVSFGMATFDADPSGVILIEELP